MRLVRVPTSDIVITPEIERFICMAAEYGAGTTPPEYLIEAVCSGQQDLWLAENEGSLRAMATTMVCRLGQMPGLCCVLTAAAGKGVDEWVGLIAGIEDYARARGCARVVIYGRRGWVRKLAPMEYQEASTVLAKTL